MNENNLFKGHGSLLKLIAQKMAEAVGYVSLYLQ
jgi:hypothetical protein